jgi:signal peptidase I
MAKRATKPTNLARPGKSSVVAQARGGKRRGRGSSSDQSSASFGRWLWENAKSLAGAIVIYLVVKTLLIEAYRIPSGSMIPTLLVGDWLFVNKAAYGPAIPFTDAHLPGYMNPKHGDVVVFISPYQPDNAPDFTPVLVKRLIGMPGDTLYMREGVLYLDGIAQRQSFAANNPKINMDDSGVVSDATGRIFRDFDWQHTIEIKNSRFGPPPAQPLHDDWGPLLIPADHYFMMGDNRYCSKDSRYWGLVPKANIRGRPLFVYYSYVPGAGDTVDPCDGDVSDRPVPFLSNIRWSRIGHWVR